MADEFDPLKQTNNKPSEEIYGKIFSLFLNGFLTENFVSIHSDNTEKNNKY